MDLSWCIICDQKIDESNVSVETISLLNHSHHRPAHPNPSSTSNLSGPRLSPLLFRTLSPSRSKPLHYASHYSVRGQSFWAYYGHNHYHHYHHHQNCKYNHPHYDQRCCSLFALPPVRPARLECITLTSIPVATTPPTSSATRRHLAQSRAAHWRVLHPKSRENLDVDVRWRSFVLL